MKGIVNVVVQIAGSLFSAACLLAPPVSADTCIESSPGVMNCYGRDGSKSTTIESTPGVFNTYGSDSNGDPYKNTIIESSPGVYNSY